MVYIGKPLTWIEKVIVKLIKLGPLPRHVGIIMDGNRRFAEKNNIAKGDGFAYGAIKLEWSINWGLKFGIQEITVYAWSIENYKRTDDELNIFMKEMVILFQRQLDNVDIYNKLGICIRFIGNWKLIDGELRNQMARLMLATKKNNKFIFNVAFAYSSRDDITHSIQCIVEGVEDGLLNINDINEELVSNCLYTNKSSTLDLVIRTSGVTRLSDFLSWNVGTAMLYNFNIYWPDFSFWSFSKAILYYQYTCLNWYQIHNVRVQISEKGSKFVAYSNERHWQQIETYARN